MRRPEHAIALSGLLAVSALLWSVPATAEVQVDISGDWTARLNEVDTNEDLRKTCTASVSFEDRKGGSGSLTLAISDGDAGPPYAYPAVAIRLGSWRSLGERTASFTDGNSTVDVTASGSGDGEWLLENRAETSLALLRQMRRADMLDLRLDSDPVATISMNGLTHAYRNLAEWCGFTADDVVN